MAHKERIIISGYYGFSNAGDEAVLSAMVGGLRAQTGNVEITVLSASPEETAGTHGVKAIPRMSRSEVSKAIRECDLLISGGGSLIQDATSFKSLAYYLSIIRLAKRRGRKVMILGQGIGPLRRTISRYFARSVLNAVDLITVRDTPSAGLLKTLGVTRPPVHVTADPTLLLEPCMPDEAARLLAQVGIAENDDVIAVSLRRWKEAPEVEASAVEAIRALSDTLPAKVLLVTMHTPDDYLLAKQVKEAAGLPENLLIQPEAWTAEQLLGVLARCRLVVGMRLHALIFAAAVGVPSVGIAYDPKVEHFLGATGQISISLSEASSSLLLQRVIEAWEHRDELASRLTEVVPGMREAAEENIRLAVELLSG